MRLLSITAALLGVMTCAAGAQEFTTSNDAVNAMMTEWVDYDASCRGALPSQGPEKFCGARDYIGWTLTRSGVCMKNSESVNDFLWERCNEASIRFDDPLKEEGKDVKSPKKVFKTDNDALNVMFSDFNRYLNICEKAEGDVREQACGIKHYIGWSLNQAGVCLKNADPDAPEWAECSAKSETFYDPLDDLPPLPPLE